MSDEETQVFLVQINYKSGTSVTMAFKKFEFEFSNGYTVSWQTADPSHRPIYMNPSEIESIYQLGLVED